jgi:peptidylprolyl isomerase
MARTRKKTRTGDTVKVNYTCRLSNGTVIDSSAEGDPLVFTLGKGEVLKGLEELINGMKIGEIKTVTVPPEKAYGAYNYAWVIEIGLDRLPENCNPEPGVQIELTRENGQPMVAMVKRVSQSSATLDFNHPLAGKELVFEVSLLGFA